MSAEHSAGATPEAFFVGPGKHVVRIRGSYKTFSSDVEIVAEFGCVYSLECKAGKPLASMGIRAIVDLDGPPRPWISLYEVSDPSLIG